MRIFSPMAPLSLRSLSNRLISFYPVSLGLLHFEAEARILKEELRKKGIS